MEKLYSLKLKLHSYHIIHVLVEDFSVNDMNSVLVYMVRIPGSHPGGPGSIPGYGTFFYFMYGSIIIYFIILLLNILAFCN